MGTRTRDARSLPHWASPMNRAQTSRGMRGRSSPQLLNQFLGENPVGVRDWKGLFVKNMYSAEETVAKLREAELMLGEGLRMSEVRNQLGVNEQA